MNGSIWPIEGTLTRTTNPDQKEPGSNISEAVLYIPQSSRNLTLQLDAV